MEYRVLMFGPHASGKSSVLASMIDRFNEIKSKTGGDVSLEPDESTKILLNRKKKNLENIFEDPKKKAAGRFLTAEEGGGTAHDYEYVFKMSIKGASEEIDIVFEDIVGEKLELSSERNNLKEKLKKSSVVIVAVDTPHMMESDGEYNAFNRTYHVQNLLESMANEESEHKLVLFVPIKCEKYYHENRMDEVNSEIKAIYANAIAAFRRNKAKQIMVAITPILTLGDVVFDDFGRDEEGEVICNEDSKDSDYMKPKEAFYKFNSEDPSFKPLFCEQPILYILNFIIKIANLLKVTKKTSTKSLMQMLFETVLFVWSWPVFLIYKATRASLKKVFTTQNVIETAEKIVQKVKTEGDGYEIIQNPFNGE